MRMRLSAVLSVAGGLITAVLGPAFIWRFVLHPRPGERVDVWFGILVAVFLAMLCTLAVVAGVRAWRQAPVGVWPLQGAVGLVVLALVGPWSPAPLLLCAALLAFLEARAVGGRAPPTPRVP